jgi:DNA polymerase-3 subunit alpha
MATYFAETLTGAVDNTVAIADAARSTSISRPITFPSSRCRVRLERRRAVRQQVREGSSAVMAVVRKKNPDLDEAVYRERLDYEIKTIINKMGFPGLFSYRGRLYPLCQKNGSAGGSRARIGGRQPGGLLPGNHRPGSH